MRTRRALLAVVVCAALLGPAAAAAAAAATPSVLPTATLPPAPLLKGAPVFDVQLWPEAGASAILINATVPTSTPLPVRVRMPLPSGATIDWIGEILGDVPEQDIPSPYRLADGGRIVETVLTTSRIAQYEATYAAPVQEGDMLVSRLEWVQSVPASSVRFAVMASAAIKDVAVTPPSKYAPQFNQAGERLYVLEPKKMKVGDKARISAAYRAGIETDPGATATSGASTSSVVIPLLAVLVIVVIGLLVVLRRQTRAARGR